MSKRFGRNRKRKAQAEIQELKNAIAERDEEIYRKDKYIHDVAMVLGSSFLKTEAGRGYLDSRVSFLEFKVMRLRNGILHPDSLTESMDIIHHSIPILRAIGYEKTPEYTYFRFQYGHNDLGFAVHPRLLKTMATKEAVAEIVHGILKSMQAEKMPEVNIFSDNDITKIDDFLAR